MSNTVHEDENWRQRLRAEQAAAGQWRDSWGFLEVNTQTQNTTNTQGEIETPSHLPCDYACCCVVLFSSLIGLLVFVVFVFFLLFLFLARQAIRFGSRRSADTESSPHTNHCRARNTIPIPKTDIQRKVNTHTPAWHAAWRGVWPVSLTVCLSVISVVVSRDGIVNSRSTVGGTAPSKLATTGSTTKVWRGDPDAPRWDPKTREFINTNKSSPSRAAGQSIINGQQTIKQQHQQQQQQQESDSTRFDSVDGVRPSTPVLSLDLALAKTLMPKYEQDIGSCVWTNGVDPSAKYRHPILASHQIGWKAPATLEFFTRGAGPNATRDLSTKRLYGWD